MYNYQTAILVNKGYDFNNVFASEQAQLTKMQGFQFTLPEVVGFLKSQSKNFTVESPMNIEVDKSIYSIVNSYHTQMGSANPFVDEVIIPVVAPEAVELPEPEPIVVAPVVAPVIVENETVLMYRKEISELEQLIEMEDSKKEIAKYNKEIAELNDLINMEMEEVTMANGGAVGESEWLITLEGGDGLEIDEIVFAKTEDEAYGKAEKLHKGSKAVGQTLLTDEKGNKIAYAKGGYVGKSAEQVWDSWTVEQRVHFLNDHFKSTPPKEVLAEAKKSFDKIEQDDQYEIEHYIPKGQYDNGKYTLGDFVTARQLIPQRLSYSEVYDLTDNPEIIVAGVGYLTT